MAASGVELRSDGGECVDDGMIGEGGNSLDDLPTKIGGAVVVTPEMQSDVGVDTVVVVGCCC